MLGCGARSEPPPHPAYQIGVEALERALDETLDADFGHPRFETARRAFEAVPPDAPRYRAARSLAARIRAGRARYEAAAAAAAARAEAERADRVAAHVRRAARIEAEAVRAREAAREAALHQARRQAAEGRDVALAIQRAGREARAMAKAREEREAERRRDRRAFEARRDLESRRQEACEVARADCRERCAWVRDSTGRSGGFGSPIAMQCLKTCPVCSPDGVSAAQAPR